MIYGGAVAPKGGHRVCIHHLPPYLGVPCIEKHIPGSRNFVPGPGRVFREPGTRTVTRFFPIRETSLPWMHKVVMVIACVLTYVHVFTWNAALLARMLCSNSRSSLVASFWRATTSALSFVTCIRGDRMEWEGVGRDGMWWDGMRQRVRASTRKRDQHFRRGGRQSVRQARRQATRLCSSSSSCCKTRRRIDEEHFALTHPWLGAVLVQHH